MGVIGLLYIANSNRCRRVRAVAQSMRDPSWRVFIWVTGRQFSERLHSADSRGQIHRYAVVELPEMRESDRALR